MRANEQLVWVDEAHDRAYASDGVSRYGAYLRDCLLIDEGEPLDAVSFAAMAWRIACQPVMSPGFVRFGRDVSSVRCRRNDENPEELVTDLEVLLPWPVHLDRLRLRGWRDWDRERPWAIDDPGPFIEPAQECRALMFRADLQLPTSTVGLPVPALPGVDVEAAKEAVSLLCQRINAGAGPVLDALSTSWREVRR
ncbi:hypothetical protein [Actinopolymorpha pittospori]|uniref:Uncharacterized protein n=1 Tax=Actinopolymorpha pittospori TaxID=648752 RepID=A0A927RAY8_9ACTN|nr:hypothetical protein [Actinopolymorpha pittospori]MBE1605550.1 hypothetical protein [Actinopolymorpha pittospori]